MWQNWLVPVTKKFASCVRSRQWCAHAQVKHEPDLAALAAVFGPSELQTKEIMFVLIAFHANTAQAQTPQSENYRPDGTTRWNLINMLLCAASKRPEIQNWRAKCDQKRAAGGGPEGALTWAQS